MIYSLFPVLAFHYYYTIKLTLQFPFSFVIINGIENCPTWGGPKKEYTMQTEIERINELRLTWAPKQTEGDDDQCMVELPDTTKVRIKLLPEPATDSTSNGMLFQRCGGGKRVIRKRIY